MRKLGLFILSIVLTLGILLTLTGCGSDLSGKWTSTSGSGAQLAFSSTGKVVMSSEGVELNGTYTSEESTVVMTLKSASDDVYIIEASYYIEGSKLYLTNDKGYTEVFAR